MGKSYFIGNGKNDLVKLDLFYTDPFIYPYLVEKDVRFASIEEIVAMKLEVIANGGRKKEFDIDVDVKPATISNLGLGVGFNLFKQKVSFGIISQQLETKLILPPNMEEISGSTPLSSFSPSLIKNSAADLDTEKDLLKLKVFKKKILPVEIKTGVPQVDTAKLAAKIKAERDKVKKKLKQQNQTPLERKLNNSFKEKNTKAEKLIIKKGKNIKKGFDLAKKNL